MIEFFTAWWSYGFMRNAFIAILIITPLFGILGTMIVNNKMAFFSDALGHSALTGIALGVVMGVADTEKAKEAMAYDVEIDHQERDIESLCMKLLLQQQPVARDLRLISAALKMITDMERIGDQASDIAEIIITEDKSEAQDIPMIIKMSEAASKMVRDSVNAYVEKDLDLARKVMENDDVVDELFEEVKTTLINFIAENKGLQGVEAIDLIMVAKYLERIADHATNIAEWVEFSITGIHKSSG